LGQILTELIAVVTVTMIVVAVAIAMIPSIVIVAMSVALAMIVVIFELTVVVAVVMPVFLAVFAAAEVLLPSTMTSPVGVLTAYRVWAVIAEARIVAAIDVTAEADRSVEPGPRTEEDSARKPGRRVVAEGRAPVRRVVVVAVRANRLDSDVDGDLCF